MNCKRGNRTSEIAALGSAVSSFRAGIDFNRRTKTLVSCPQSSLPFDPQTLDFTPQKLAIGAAHNHVFLIWAANCATRSTTAATEVCWELEISRRGESSTPRHCRSIRRKRFRELAKDDVSWEGAVMFRQGSLADVFPTEFSYSRGCCERCKCLVRIHVARRRYRFNSRRPVHVRADTIALPRDRIHARVHRAR